MSNRATRTERQAYKWVMKMLDDPGRHAGALERWLSKDDEHRAVYKRVAIEVGRASDVAGASPALRSVALAAQRPSGWGTKGRVVAVGGLTVVGLAVAGVFGVLNTSIGSSGAGIIGTAPQNVFAAGEADRTIRLEDASVVTLFAHSRLETNYSKAERSVRLLSGKARFAVAHNSARPFVVYAGGGRVTATGTLFEVAFNGAVKVRLISGSVDVSYPRASRYGPQKVVRLGAGEQVSYPVAVPPPAAPATPESTPLAAQTTESFDDVPATEIAAKANRSSAIKIEFAEPALGARKVVADFNTSDAQAVAQKLAILLGLVVDRSQPGRLILKRQF